MLTLRLTSSSIATVSSSFALGFLHASERSTYLFILFSAEVFPLTALAAYMGRNKLANSKPSDSKPVSQPGSKRKAGGEVASPQRASAKLAKSSQQLSSEHDEEDSKNGSDASEEEDDEDAADEEDEPEHADELAVGSTSAWSRPRAAELRCMLWVHAWCYSACIRSYACTCMGATVTVKLCKCMHACFVLVGHKRVCCTVLYKRMHGCYMPVT